MGKAAPRLKAVYGSRPTKRQRRTKAQLGKLEESLYRIIQEMRPMTVRQVFYQAVSAGLIDKTEQEYKNSIGRTLVNMRRRGDLPYDWIADNTRWMRKPTTYDSVEEAIQNAAASYRRALWSDQEVYVEVWLEKDALAGVIVPVTRSWDVPLMVTRGFPSVSFLHSAAESIKAHGKPAHLYYFGDHDPSGVHIDRNTEIQLRAMATGVDIEFRRVAVRECQIEEFGLLTRPTKKSDSRSRGFVGDSVELDAIPPGELRQMVTRCITSHIDERTLAATREQEAREKEIFGDLVRYVTRR